MILSIMSESKNLRRTLGKNLRFFRQKKGLSQAQLAELCDISRNYIAEIETENKTPSFTRFERLADALGVEPYELLLPEDRVKTLDQRNTLVRAVTAKIHEAVNLVEEEITSQKRRGNIPPGIEFTHED
jgi:transcriptional regulator with XRE-family HTH domain